MSAIVRRNRHGRANLFLGGDVAYTNVHGSSSVTRETSSSVFHTHRTCTLGEAEWLQPNDLLCFHCCHAFETPPVPVPIAFDMRERTFTVFGNFCSLSCAKAHIIYNQCYDTSTRLVHFTRMARDVYGAETVVAAADRLTLKAFGGCVGIDEFRRSAKLFKIHSAPFVCNYMVVEECCEVKTNAVANWKQTIRGLRRPLVPVDMQPATTSAQPSSSLFESYITSRCNPSATPNVSDTTAAGCECDGTAGQADATTARSSDPSSGSGGGSSKSRPHARAAKQATASSAAPAGFGQLTSSDFGVPSSKPGVGKGGGGGLSRFIV
tara:strand:+ start:72 stop:1037 length:966 start_codon:yes stop_codon:yes gene_type:complete